MNSTDHSKNIMIFDGTLQEEIYKGEFQFGEEIITRDLTGQNKSSVKIEDTEGVVQKLDTFVIGTYLPFPIRGRIIEIESDSSSSIKVLSLIWGADVHTNEYFNENLTFVPNNVQEDNLQSVSIFLETNTAVSVEKNITGIDVIARNLMILNNHEEIMDTGDIKIRQLVDNGDYKIRIDDPILANRSISFGEDSYNNLRLYQPKYTDENTGEEIITGNFADYFLTEDFEVSIDPAEKTLPVIRDYEENDQWSDFQYAKNTMEVQKFDNEINFTVSLNNDEPALKFDNTFLGRRIKIYLREGYINSIISKYTIMGDSIDITCGLGRSRLTQLLNKDRR